MKIPQIAIVFNWRNEHHKTGLYSIYLRVTIQRKSKYYKITVPQKIAPNQWSGTEDAWIKSSHPFAFEINNKIREKKTIVHDLIKRAYSFNKSLSFETIFSHLDRKGDRNSFLDFFQQYIDNPPETLAENTIKKYKTCLQHLKGFQAIIHFSDIENTLITSFHKFLQKEKQLKGGACKKYMESLKKVIKHARKENYLDPSQMEFLFEDVQIRVERSKRTFLEPKEILAWKNATFPPGKEHLERDRDLFLFQIYTGYYYKDLFIFTKSQLLEDEEYGFIIVGARDKNDNQTIIPLFKFPHAANIIRKYQSAKTDKTIFDLKYLIVEAIYNKHLKEIAKYAGISKLVSNKTGRHTNAQLWVRYGAERPILSKMMGHTKEQTTNNYFSVNIPEIVEGTKRVDFNKLGI